MRPGNGNVSIIDHAPTLAPLPRSRHHPYMGRDPTHHVKPDLFSTASVGDTSPAAANPVWSAHEPRHVLPKDLPNAVKHLNDEELDRLLAVTLAEAKRRGRHTTVTEKRLPSRNAEVAVSLTRGQLNAVRAAFKAGITTAPLMPSHWQRSKMTFCQSRKNESSRPGWESWASCNPKCRGSNSAAPAGESGLCASIRPRADGRQEPPAL